ncbi:arsenic resistance N-acetyltransferase ArsN2 [Mucilaginibacter psychrotolerans]|nr:arsenic resistance N-acetyltransferase ArsN2 [Mucilaginibacter psychrotolerans]
MTIENAAAYQKEAIALLTAENLPVDDLSENLPDFFVAIEGSEIIGVAGMEVYGNYGLLRSVAVLPSRRGQGIAGKLVGQVESAGKQKGLSALYLLTETAADYFKNKGYAQIDRAQVPTAIQISSEFSHVCPVSAIVMEKEL